VTASSRGGGDGLVSGRQTVRSPATNPRRGAVVGVVKYRRGVTDIQSRGHDRYHCRRAGLTSARPPASPQPAAAAGTMRRTHLLQILMNGKWTHVMANPDEKQNKITVNVVIISRFLPGVV